MQELTIDLNYPVHTFGPDETKNLIQAYTVADLQCPVEEGEPMNHSQPAPPPADCA